MPPLSTAVIAGFPASTSTATRLAEEMLAELVALKAMSYLLLSGPSGVVTELGGTRVMINGDYVPILYASPLQVNFLCPAIGAGTPLRISIESEDGATEPLSTVMQDVGRWRALCCGRYRANRSRCGRRPRDHG